MQPRHDVNRIYTAADPYDICHEFRVIGGCALGGSVRIVDVRVFCMETEFQPIAVRLELIGELVGDIEYVVGSVEQVAIATEHATIPFVKRFQPREELILKNRGIRVGIGGYVDEWRIEIVERYVHISLFTLL